MLNQFGVATWNPIAWVFVFAILVLLVWLFRSRGRKAYRKGTEATKVFLSGVEVPDAEARHIRAHNIYWGFFETMKGYYAAIMKPHTGIINDYMTWFLAVMALLAMAVLIVR